MTLFVLLPAFQLPLFIRRDLGTSQSVCRDKKFLATIFVMKTAKYSRVINLSRNRKTIWTERTEQYARKENEINKVGIKLDDLQTLLIKLTVKASAEKAWLFYELPFSLNPGGKPNDAQTWKKYSSLHPVSTEAQFHANSKKKLRRHFRGSKIKPAKY